MSAHQGDRRRLTVFLGLLVVGALCLAASVLAQRPRNEEEEDPKTQKPTRRIEVEDETPVPVKRKEIRVDDTGTPTKPPVAEPELVIDLGVAARQTRHPGIRRLFEALARPYDVVTISNSISPRSERVEPIPQFIGEDRSRIKGSIRLNTLTADNKPSKSYDIPVSDKIHVEYFEQMALARVNEFLDTRWENNVETAPGYLSIPDKLLAAEQALTAVARFHESERKRGGRQGEEWDPVLAALRKKLLAVVLARLSILVDRGNWDEALALAKQAAQRFPTRDDHKVIAQPLAKLVEQVLRSPLADDDKYREVQKRLRAIDEEFPNCDATESISKTLREQADKLMAQARGLALQKKLKEAAVLARQAEDIYPHLAGVRAFRLDVEGKYPILRIGARELPQYVSPALATTDSERQAVELLFESLVQLSPETQGGTFVPALALGRPTQVPMGREFVLPRDLYWSNSQPLSALDVRNTVLMLQNKSWPGRNVPWADDLIDSAIVENDPHRLKITLRQGYLEPLSLMDFKVLPRIDQPDSKDFARKPVSSGPFQMIPGQQSVEGRPYVLFRANPFYSNRPGKQALPRIREIQFFETNDPVKEFRQNRLDLVLEVPTDKVTALKELRNVEVSPPLRMRRIYFLAVNHRNQFLSNAHFRRALVHAIPREKLLDEHFRADLGKKVHHPLNGPFPVDTWAYNPRLKADPFDSGLAKNQMQQAEKEKSNLRAARLSLKYPRGDAQVEGAMQAIRDQVQKELGIPLELQEMEPHELREAVQVTHNYDLAYFFHDYPDHTFWVWPLFDPRGNREGGMNYLGYVPNARVQSLFREAMSYRSFAQVRELTQTLHEVLYHQEVPFVPLWQLDRHIAYRDRLKLYNGNHKIVLDENKPAALDPLYLLRTIDGWKLE